MKVSDRAPFFAANTAPRFSTARKTALAVKSADLIARIDEPSQIPQQCATSPPLRLGFGGVAACPMGAVAPALAKSCVDGARFARVDLTVWRYGRVQSCVRPFDAVAHDRWP